MHRTTLVTAPTEEPVSLAEAKLHLGITSSTWNDKILNLIVSARRRVERFTGRALVTQTWKVFYNHFSYEMLIPFAPLQSITHLKYYDTTGTFTTMTLSDYYWTVTTDDPGRLITKYNVTVPELQDGRPDAIEIQFVAGYGAASAVPEELKDAMKLLITDLFEERGTLVTNSKTGVLSIPGYFKDVLHSYKLYDF